MKSNFVKILFFISMVVLTQPLKYSVAQSNKPTFFKNGINANTNILDNNGNILSNMNINKPFGLVSSDKNNNIVNSVIGDVSNAPVVGNSTSFPRTNGRRAIDIINMANDMILNGHGDSNGDTDQNTDPTLWQTLRNGWGGDKVVILPSGYVPPSNLEEYSIESPTAPDPTNKNIFYFAPSGLKVLGANGNTYGRTLIDTDNDTTISPFGGSLHFDKHTITAGASNPIINMVYENSSPNIGQTSGGGMFAKLPPINVNVYQDPNAYGSLTGISFWMVDQSNGDKAPLLNQSQIFDGTIIRDGKSSTWGFSLSHRDTTGIASNGFAQTYAELDGSANGTDGGNPVYSPGDGNRKGIWIQSGSENAHMEGIGKNARIIENSTWVASTSYIIGQRARVVASDGKFHLYDVIASGTSGTTAPTWTIGTSDIITDGSVQWKHLGQFNAGFSKAIFIDGNNYFGDGDSWFDTILTSNNNVYGAFIDVSKVKFIDPTTSFTVQVDSNGNPVPDGHGGIKYNYTASSYGAALRMAADMNIDFTADGTPAGLNKRRISWVSVDKSLEYLVSNSQVFKIDDNGNISNLGISIFGTGGQSILNLNTQYSLTGTTIGSNLWNNGNGDTDILGGEGGLMLGAVKWKDGHPNTNPALEIQNNNHVVFHDLLVLDNMSKNNILSISSPVEGAIINDSDNHVPVIYENGKWYPIQLGTSY